MRADGTHARLECGGPVIAGVLAGRYAEDHVDLRPDDRLVLFTDGLTELPDAGGAEFGEGLVELVKTHRQLDAATLKDTLLEAAHAFGGGSLVDDTTLLVLAVG